MTRISLIPPKTEGSAIKHVVVAESTKGGLPQFLNKDRTSLKADLADACLFDSPAVASRNITKLIGMDWEREHGVTLALGQVSLVLLSVAAPVAKKTASGFILRRKDGQYYCGPKGRNANSFVEACYNYKPNPDVATVFRSEQQAAERVEGILVELRKAVVPTDSAKTRSLYKRCVAEGRCDIVAV